MRIKIFVISIFLITLLILSIGIAPAEYAPGDTTLDFWLQDSNNQSFHLYDYQGYVIVFGFWRQF